MDMTRRQALGAGAAASMIATTPMGAFAATTERRFTILRGGSDIGRHVVRLTREGAGLRVDIDIEIVVRILGIAAYRYEMTNREIWRDGALQSIDSDVNDDGARKRVRATRENGQLVVDAPNFSGEAPSEAVSTTYFSQSFLKRPVWISTDAGDLFNVSASLIGEESAPTPNGPTAATRHRVRSGDEYDVEIVYSREGEWVGLSFDAGGERAEYRLDRFEPGFAGLWNGA